MSEKIGGNNTPPNSANTNDQWQQLRAEYDKKQLEARKAAAERDRNEVIQEQWDDLQDEMENAATQSMWEKQRAEYDKRQSEANNSDLDQTPAQDQTKDVAAYNEAHADEMYENWREGQGLDDEDFADPIEKHLEEARAYNEAHADEMYENWREGQGLSNDEYTPGRIESMYQNPNGEYYQKDETEERWRAFYANRGEEFGDESKSEQKDSSEKRPSRIVRNLDEYKNHINKPDTAEGQPKTIEELEKELEENEKRQAEIDAELMELNASGLIAVNANIKEDRDALATLEAENAFNTEKGNAKFFKRIWMNYFEKYYKTKYKKEILSGDRTIEVDGEQVDIDTIIHDRSRGGIGRVVKSVAENEMDYIHQQFNEKQGELDEKTTEAVRQAIMEYANERGDNADEKLFTAKLKEQIAKLKQEGNYENPDYVNNYFEVAENAIKIKELMRGEVAMEKVLEKFAVYNDAVIHDEERTEVHRDTLDQLINKFENSKISRFISPETIAVATSVVSLLAKSGLGRAARLLIPVGGIVTSGILAGAKERRRVTNDRETMMRNRENGQEYDENPNLDEIDSRVARKRAKYESKIAGTNYDIKPAKDLISDINEALESGDEDKIMEAYTAARVRTDISDSEKKGLISFSSASKRGDERLALDTAIIEAKRRINTPENKAKLEEMAKAVAADIEKDVDEKDADFKKIRAKQVAKQVTKTVAIGAATFVLSQEAMAALSDKQVGILEKAGWLPTKNQAGAKETMLASFYNTEDAGVIKGISADNESEIRNLEQRGYKGTKVVDETTTTRTTYVEGNPSSSAQKANVYVQEWANNGTEPYDGNELNAAMDDKYNLVTTMHGDSYAPNSGRILNFENLVQENRLRGFVTIKGIRFEAQGTLLDNGQVEFIHNGMIKTPGGAMIEAIDRATGSKLYEYLEIGGVYGKDPTTGLREFVPMATDVGVPEGSGFTGMFQEPVTEVVTTPAVYDFALPPAEDVTYGGIVAPVSTARVGIGRGVPRQETSDQGDTGDNPPTLPGAPAGDDNPGTVEVVPPTSEPEPEPDNGETPPAADEPTPNSGDNQPNDDQPADDQAPQDTGEDDSQKDNVYTKMIKDMADELELGEDRLKILLEKPEDSGPREDNEYLAVFRGLQPEIMQRVFDTVQKYATDETLEGKGFRDWIARYIESSRQQAA